MPCSFVFEQLELPFIWEDNYEEDVETSEPEIDTSEELG